MNSLTYNELLKKMKKNPPSFPTHPSTKFEGKYYDANGNIVDIADWFGDDEVVEEPVDDEEIVEDPVDDDEPVDDIPEAPFSENV